jgi:hypothetical protein
MFDTNFGKPDSMTKAVKGLVKTAKGTPALNKGGLKGMKKGMVVTPAKTLGKGK